MPPPDEIRIRHLVEAAQKAIAYSENRSREELQEDELLRLALTKLVEIVGEAAKQVTAPTQQLYPQIPWAAAARMRDRVVHHYFDINLDVFVVDRHRGPTRSAGRPWRIRSDGLLIRRFAPLVGQLSSPE